MNGVLERDYVVYIYIYFKRFFVSRMVMRWGFGGFGKIILVIELESRVLELVVLKVLGSLDKYVLGKNIKDRATRSLRRSTKN